MDIMGINHGFEEDRQSVPRVTVWHHKADRVMPNSFVCLFVCLRLYIPVKRFSVILGRLRGINQY